jgi:phosphoribosylformylglycinamidine (FGAM) synthase-like amidotransferase family enzyme
MKIGVVTFPGSNCDYDCYKAVQEGWARRRSSSGTRSTT